MWVTFEPLGGADDAGSEGTDVSNAIVVAANDTVIVEGLHFLWLADPEGTEHAVTG